MLILSQNEGDSVYVFDKNGKKILRVTFIKKVNGRNQIKMSFDAGKDIKILREKLLIGKSSEEISEMINRNKDKRSSFEINGNIREGNKKYMVTEEGGYYEKL